MIDDVKPDECAINLVTCTSCNRAQLRTYEGQCEICWRQNNKGEWRFSRELVEDSRWPIPFDEWRGLHPDGNTDEYFAGLDPVKYGSGNRELSFEKPEKTVERLVRRLLSAHIDLRGAIDIGYDPEKHEYVVTGSMVPPILCDRERDFYRGKQA